MQLRNSKGQYKSHLMIKVVKLVLGVAMFLGSVAFVLEKLNDKQVIPDEVLIPVVEDVELTELEKVLADLNEVERKICEMFPITECRVALAIQQSENDTQDPERYYVEADGEISVGIFQIKAENWNTERCPYGLHDLTTVEPNIECAYNLWDACDGELGNDKGCWHRWGTWVNGSVLRNL